MATRVTAQAGSLVAAIVVITSAAILRGPIAVADPQDDQFLALLAKNDIPALEGVPSLITEAHNVCRALDAGYTVDDVVKAMLDNAYSADPGERNFDKGRLMRTESRFISSAVGAYCPYDQGKITSIMSNAMPIRNDPAARGAAYTPKSSGAALVSLTGKLPEISPTDPPQIPAPKPPDAQTLSPPVPIAAPPPPRQVPRQQPQQSPPQQVAPPEASAPPPPEAPPPPPEAPPPPPPPQAPPPPPPPEAPPPPPPEPPKPPPPPPPPPPSSPPGFVRLAP